MIEVTGLQFAYPESDFQLQIDSLTIEEGAKVAVVGPSGCGKTTLLYLLAGICIPHSGEIKVAGKEIHTMSDSQARRFRHQTLGFIFQEFELLDYLTGRENILLPLHINLPGEFPTSLADRVESLSESLGVRHVLNRHPGQMSQGEKQRVAICRSLLFNPRVLLADEPTGNLDPERTREILHLILDQAEKDKHTFVMVTHDHSLLGRFDQIVDFQSFRGRVLP